MADREEKSELSPHIRETVRAIGDLHAAHRAGATKLERRLETAAAMAANPSVLIVVSLLIVAWLAANLAADRMGFQPFDPFPYNLLQGALTVFTVYVSLAILTAQRRAGALADLRAQVTLEHCILGEHKAAKAIELLEELRRDAPGIRDRVDFQADAMSSPADPKAVAEAIVETHNERRSKEKMEP
jgi:uncharacterized membrane protein